MENAKEKIKEFPTSPGIYIFRNDRGQVIYVGKAINLARRISSYFLPKHQQGPKTQLLQSQIDNIEVIQTASEFDAILLETRLIRKYTPYFNIIAKDDKSPLYIKITLSEELPRVIFLRKTQLVNVRKKDVVIGPFQSGRLARRLLSEIRHSIPFCLQKRRDGKPCFYTHIGLCQPCPSYIAKLGDTGEKNDLLREYRKHMYQLVRILSGKSKDVLRDMDTAMRAAAKLNDFEAAGRLKNQIESLITVHARHHDPSIYEDALAGRTFTEELSELQQKLASFFPGLKIPERIECIDISNLAGGQATGSLVVLVGGYPASSEYRRFRIRSKSTPDDTFMIREVLTRRLRHPEWPFPDLLVIDGGKPQVHAAQAILAREGFPIAVIGLAKRFEEIIVPQGNGFATIRLSLASGALHVLQRIRDEAHRFAKTYHVFLRRSIGSAKIPV